MAGPDSGTKEWSQPGDPLTVSERADVLRNWGEPVTKTGPGWWGSCCLHGALEAGPPEGLPSRTEGGKAGWWACSHCSHTGPYLVSCFAVAILKFFLKKRLCTGPPRLCSQSWGRGKQGGVLYSRIPSNKWRRADTARKSPCCIQNLIHAEIVHWL